MARPERSEFIALAIVAALQSDPSGRTVHTGSNPYVPLLNGSFDMLRAARATEAAAAQWDAAYAADTAEVAAALVAPAEPEKPAHERREAILKQLQLVDDEIIAAIELQEKVAAAALAGTPAPSATSSTDAAQATGATPSAAEPDPGT